MPGQRLGSVRISSFEQNSDRQLDGLVVDRRFSDHASCPIATPHRGSGPWFGRLFNTLGRYANPGPDKGARQRESVGVGLVAAGGSVQRGHLSDADGAKSLRVGGQNGTPKSEYRDEQVLRMAGASRASSSGAGSARCTSPTCG